MQSRHTVLGVAALLAAGAIGCSGQADSEPIGSSEENLVFEEAFSDTGRLKIYENADGLLDVSVAGKIGVDDHVALTKKLRPSLVEMYQQLLPDSAVPERLFEFDERLQAQRDRSGTEAEPAPAVDQQKDAIAFIDALCKQHPWGSGQTLVTNHCRFRNSVAEVCTDATYDPNDLSNGWNETPWSTLHWKSDLLNPADIRSIGPWTFWWNAWGGGGSNKSVCLTIHGSGVTGTLGITHHDRVTTLP